MLLHDKQIVILSKEQINKIQNRKHSNPPRRPPCTPRRPPRIPRRTTRRTPRTQL